MPNKALKEEKEDNMVHGDDFSATHGSVEPEGGKVKPRRADANNEVDPESEEVDDGVTDVEEAKNRDKEKYEDEHEEDDDDDISESISSLFEGENLSEDFQRRATVIFEAAVNEAATRKAEKISASLAEEFDAKVEEAAKEMNESLNETVNDLEENLSKYLDYAVKEWMKENEIAIESGIKVEMAESFMNGLKELFYEHNVEIDEESMDVVSEMEKRVEEQKERTRKAINENISLKEKLKSLDALRVIDEMSEGLTESQKDRLVSLSERLDVSDMGAFKDDVRILRETFFKDDNKSNSLNERAGYDQEDDAVVLEEDNRPQRTGFDTVDAVVASINRKYNK